MSDAVLSQFAQTVEAQQIDASKKLKVGIIGTGWIAEAHVESYKEMPDVEIVAAADLIPGKAEAFMKRYGVEGVRFYPDHKAMLDAENLDVVSICTYNVTHAECTIYALEKGVNVLLEKPMCVTIEEAADIMRAEKKSGKILSIGFQPRLDANMQMIKKSLIPGHWAKSTTFRPGAAAAAASPTVPLSRKGLPALAPWGILAATVWIWCSMPSAIPSP